MENTENKNIIDYKVKRTRYYLGDSEQFIEIDEGDMNMPIRIQQMKKDIDEYIDSLKTKYGINDIDDLGSIKTGDVDEEIQVFVETDNFIKDKFNYAFDYDVSAAAFGNASSLSVTEKGEYYFESFFNAVVPVIEKTFDTRIDKLGVRVKKYTDRKGMHPALKK